jgi:hypothetical protein
MRGALMTGPPNVFCRNASKLARLGAQSKPGA